MGKDAVKRVKRKDGKAFGSCGEYVGIVRSTIRNPKEPESFAYLFENLSGCVNVDECEDILEDKEIIEKEIQRRYYVLSHRVGGIAERPGDKFRKDELNRLLEFIKEL